MRRLFIIGPGGAGKTTCGELFAGLIGCRFADLDSEFMNRVGHIGRHIEDEGYLSYCRKNSALFYALLEEQSADTVFALSSGFLVHEDTDSALSKHKDAIRNGVSILLLPSRSAEETERIIVSRQMSRDIKCREESERRKIRDRFPKYCQYGDIQVFSRQEPIQVAEEMKTRYDTFSEPAGADGLLIAAADLIVMHRNNSKYRRMVERLPEEMKELMRHVHHDCVIIKHHAGSMGWRVDFQIGNTDLNLTYDRGSLVVIKDPTGEDKNLFPEGKDWTEVSVQDLADEVNKEFA